MSHDANPFHKSTTPGLKIDLDELVDCEGDIT
jgi:hypothetical protein